MKGNDTESTRQQKVGRQIQKDLSELLQRELSDLAGGAMVTVTAVRMSPDLGYARVYVSVFPFDRAAAVMKSLEGGTRRLRGALGARLRNQVRTVPELTFFLDDSLEYVGRIDELLG